MDELLKLLKELLQREPTPKGGIANTPAGINFIGRTLTKEEKGADMIPVSYTHLTLPTILLV